jgi:hypothetical protein
MAATLMQICRDDQMPDHETVKRWTRNVTAGAVCTIRHGEDGMDSDEARSTRGRAREGQHLIELAKLRPDKKLARSLPVRRLID